MNYFISMLMLVVMWIVIVFYCFPKQIKDWKDEMLKPDTTITIRNGIPDTAIVKKSTPWYLR